MRNLPHIELSVQKPINKFTYDDITNALFYNLQPTFIIRPFLDLPHIILRNITIPTKLYLFHRPKTISKTLKKAFSNKIAFSKVLEISPWMMGRIVNKYKEGVEEWTDYVIDNLREYCITFESRLRWGSLKVGANSEFYSKKFTVEKSLWVYLCQLKDIEEGNDFTLKVRDSLLPWFNYELWQKVEKKKQTTRVNIGYEEIKNKIINNSFTNEDDLDIIS